MKRQALLAIVALAAVIPFASRAVFLDEHLFLKIARSAQTRWLFPQDTPGMFFGTALPDFASHTHPPVGEYYLALIDAALGHFREIPYRLLFSGFPIAAVLAFYSLARRFVAEPLWLAILFAWSPAFFVYAPTLMMDVPMLAFLLAGFALYFKYTDGRRWALPASALCFTLAVGTGYTALVPLGCFGVGLWAARRPARELLSVAAAPAALALWLIGMTLHFGRFPLVATAMYFVSQGSMFWNFVAVFTFLGGVAVFPFAVAGKRVCLLALLVAFAAAGFWPEAFRLIWLVILGGSGVMILAVFAKSARRLLTSGQNGGEGFLLLWAPVTLIFFILAGDMINGRYILLAIPPIYLIAFRETSRRFMVGMLIPTALLSVSVAYADFEFVNANRAFVEQEVAPLQRQGFAVWGGAESGLRFYLEERGIVSLRTIDTKLASGDLIVRYSGFPFRYGLSPGVEDHLAVRQKFTFASAFPLRTFNALSRAGLHDSRLGLAPFTFSTEPLEHVEIQVVCAPSPPTPSLPLSQRQEDLPGRNCLGTPK